MTKRSPVDILSTHGAVDLAPASLAKFSELDVARQLFIGQRWGLVGEHVRLIGGLWAMQITFKSLVRPRRAAKALCEHVPSLKLSEAQEAIARMSGYATWRDLKAAAEAPDADASADDEELGSEALAERREFQARHAQAVLGNTMVQAREVVRLVTPTARVPATVKQEGSPGGKPLVGTAVYMPSPLIRFEPNYGAVFGLLYDVARLKIDFIQPSEHEPLPTHLAERMTFYFDNGQRLELQGVYFWKFLDLVPRELSDAEGNYFRRNPYGRSTMQELMQRLRTAYQFMFTERSVSKLSGNPPMWVEIDMINGTVATKRAAAIEGEIRKQFRALFEQQSAAVLESLAPMLNRFVSDALEGPRVELKLVNKGGRGSKVFGNEYVKSSWVGTGHWTLEDLMQEMSPEPMSESGCGGNLRYRDLLNRALEPSFKDLFEVTCAEAVQNNALYGELCEQLEIGDGGGRASTKDKAKELADALWGTPERLELAFRLTSAVLKGQKGRTFMSWCPGLTEDQALERPSERIEKLLKQYRQDRK